MPVTPFLRDQLLAVVRDCKIKLIGQDLVKNDSEAALLIAVTKAFGDSPAGFIYAAPSRARSTLHPPDVVLCHPEVGLLVIEAKGFGIDQVEGVEAGSINVRYQGYVRPENVIRQVEDQMFEIDADIMRIIRDRRSKPLTNCMVAFPRISEADWTSRGYDKAHPSTQLLFKEQIEDIGRLKKRVANLVREGLALAHRESPLTLEQVDVIGRVFGNSDVINERRPPRALVPQDKLGSYIDEMMTLDKYLSEEQKELSRMEFEGTQRLIRGVAGSGKSVVLANLVARYLHRRLEALDGDSAPALDTSIAVTCFNHALVDFLRTKVRVAYRAQTLNDNLPANVMQVVHLNNLMWQLRQNGWPIKYIRVQDVPDSTERARQYRAEIAEFARNNPSHYNSVCFDVLFVDEGQDIEPEEYRLLLDLIRPHPTTGEKPIVIFYDDAQNLYGRSRPVWREIGINVAVGDRSRVMRECFRNTRQIIELAFNVLLGSQAPADLRVQTRTYADVAYLKERGLVEEVGDHFRVRFAEREYQAPHVEVFPSEAAEIVWLGKELTRLICEQSVRPEDILVVFYKPSLFDFDSLERKVTSAVPGLRFIHPFGKSDDKDRYIFQEGCLTLSTTYGAKGYDSAIVFVVGADKFETSREGRAGFFVAATRAKLFLYVTGAQRGTEWTLLKEAQAIRQVL